MKRLGQGLSVFLMLICLRAGQLQSEAGLNQTAARTSSSSSARADGSVASPEEVGLSSERLGRVASSVQREVDNGRIAGAVTLVARHGKIAYLKAFGQADKEGKKAMQTDSIFRICSMTKPITSIAVMILYEEGRFMLNEPVSDFIPEFKDIKVLDPPYPQDRTSPPRALISAKRPITIRHLLTHTSGLTYHWNGRLGKKYHDLGIGHGILPHEGTIGKAVKKLASLPLLFQPGDAWEYSLSDDVLGYLVEVASGMPLDRFFKERIFKPLGMKDTGFFPTGEELSRLAAAYSYSSEKGLQLIPVNQTTQEPAAFVYSSDYPYRGPKTYFSGGGGLCSTAEDYYRFCQMLLNKGELNGTRLLSRKSVELISQDQVQGKLDESGFGFGFGVNSEAKHLKELGSIGAYYWGGFFYTSFVIDPKEDLIAIFMGQLHPTGGLNLDSKTLGLAYQALND